MSKEDIAALTELLAWLECNIEMDTPIHFDNEGKLYSKQMHPILDRAITQLNKETKKLLLTPVTLDSGNCRLYVKDQNNKPLVIIDQGHLAAKYGAQYELYTHTKDGEPCSPILSEWELNSDIEQAFKR